MPKPQKNEDEELIETSYSSDIAGAIFFAIGLFVIVSSIVIVILYLFYDWDLSKLYGTPPKELTFSVTREISEDSEEIIDYKLSEEYQTVKAVTKNSLAFGFSDIFESRFSWVYPLEKANQDGSLRRVNTDILGYAVETTSEKDYYDRYASSVFGDYLLSQGFIKDYFNWDGSIFFAYRKGDLVCRIMNGLGDPANKRTRLSCGKLAPIAPVAQNAYGYLEVLGKIKKVFPNYSSPQPTIMSWSVDEKTDESGSKQLGGYSVQSSGVRGDEVDLYLKFLGFEPDALNVEYGPQANIIGMTKDSVACRVYKQNIYREDQPDEPPYTIEQVDTTVSCGNMWWYFY